MEDGRLKIEDGNEGGQAWRLFVAISPPENVKDEIEKAQKQLRDAFPGNLVRWTKREQFHLTLKFLGNVAAARLSELTEALTGACCGAGALHLRAEGIGFFPGARVPRVLWVGVHDEKEKLQRLQESLEMSVKEFMDENAAPPGSAVVPTASSENVSEDSNSPARRRRSQEKFIGHVTVGRIAHIKRSQAEMLAKAVSAMANQFFGEWVANHVELIRSKLSTVGSHYTTLAEIPLMKKQ